MMVALTSGTIFRVDVKEKKEALEFDRENSRGAPLNNQTLLTEEQADSRVDTDQVLSRSMQVTS